MGAGYSQESDTFDLRPEEINNLSTTSNFTRTEVRKLYKRFRKLDHTASGTLSRDDLMRIPELAMNPLVEQILTMFDFGDEGVNFRDFVQGLSVFSSNADDDRKLHAAFRMYDSDKDGFISPGDLAYVLQTMVGKSMNMEEVEEIVERVMEEADEDQDGMLSFGEFKTVLQSTSLPQTMTILKNHSLGHTDDGDWDDWDD